MAEMDERFLDVNAHGVLRIPLELWLATLVLARSWAIALFTIASLLGNQFNVIRLFNKDSPFLSMAIGFPAVVVLWLLANRLPDASPLVRRLWPLARPLLLATAVGNLGYMLWALWQSSYWSLWPELFLASLGLIDMAICWGIYSSGYLIQVFREFPDAAANHSPSKTFN